MLKIIVAPHIDDEVLGCGGILDENTFVFYCGVDAVSYTHLTLPTIYSV